MNRALGHPQALDNYPSLFTRLCVGKFYTTGGGAVCELMEIYPTHVVVTWRVGKGSFLIYMRGEFEGSFRQASAAPGGTVRG